MMEADWEIEIGGGAPLIEADWAGFVDIRHSPDCAGSLPEANLLPGLAEALVKLNAPSSAVWTSKCDVFTPDAFDADELDATKEDAAVALACYIDLLPKGQQWVDSDATAAWCRIVCGEMKRAPLRNCRADLVIRGAQVRSDLKGIGITAYFTGCGRSAEDVALALKTALDVFAESVMRARTAAAGVEKLQ